MEIKEEYYWKFNSQHEENQHFQILDKYSLFTPFINKEMANYCIDKLYFRKESINLDSIIGQTINEKELNMLLNNNKKHVILDISLDYLLPILNKWLLKMKVSELWNRKWLHLKIKKDTLKKVQWLKNYTDKEKEILINSPLQVYVQLDKLTKKEISSFVKDWATLTEMGYFYNPRIYTKETSQKWIEKVKKIWKNITNSNDRQTFEMFWVEITLLENVFESDYVNNK